MMLSFIILVQLAGYDVKLFIALVKPTEYDVKLIIAAGNDAKLFMSLD